MTLNYGESFSKEHGSELLHYGVKGMKWGVRNNTRITASRSTKAKPTLARKREEKDIARTKEVARLVGLKERVLDGKATVTVNGKRLSTQQAVKKIDKQIEKNSSRIKSHTKAKTVVTDDKAKTEVAPANESSINRYNRLREQVAKKGANSLEDDDLKFLNTRREALAKANAAYNTKNSKLQQVVKAAIEATLTKQLNTSVEQLSQIHVAPRMSRLVNRTNRNPTPTPTP